ncbi:hypothetical protein [Mesonia aestuariivivens]|nr:hypothetical protein [Mesonia aestuariivivens]
MRQAKVFCKDVIAATITETNEGDYIFQYKEYYTKEITLAIKKGTLYR